MRATATNETKIQSIVDQSKISPPVELFPNIVALDKNEESAGEEPTTKKRKKYRSNFPPVPTNLVGVRLTATKSTKMKTIYSEFCGIHQLQDVPIPGGFFGMEEKFDASWRKSPIYSTAENQNFLRINTVMVGLKRAVEECDDGNEEALFEKFDLAWFSKPVNQVCKNVDKRVKTQGFVERKNKKQNKSE